MSTSFWKRALYTTIHRYLSGNVWYEFSIFLHNTTSVSEIAHYMILFVDLFLRQRPIQFVTSVSFRVPPPLPVMSASFHFFLLCCQRALYPTLRVTQDVGLSSFVKSPVQYVDVDLLPQRALCTVSHGSLSFYRDMCDASCTSCSIL